MGSPPPDEVLQAFGAAGAEPVPLPGGEGRSWLVGDLVCKPVDDEVSAVWAADLLSRIEEDGFRVARPVATSDGHWTSVGWTASRRLEGEHAPRWADVIGAGEAFHRAVRDEPRPAFLDHRDDPWAIGDRVAWNDLPIETYSGAVEELGRLGAARRPVAAGSQLIHGDLTENILFGDGLLPAVIDLSPYWRPTGFASAIVVADALLWHGAGREILDTAAELQDVGQMLIRALIYRLVTHVIFHSGWPLTDDALPVTSVSRAVDLALN